MNLQTLPTPLLSVSEAARLANVSPATIRREVERGNLPVLHVGSQLRFDPVAFEEYLRGGRLDGGA